MNEVIRLVRLLSLAGVAVVVVGCGREKPGATPTAGAGQSSAGVAPTPDPQAAREQGTSNRASLPNESSTDDGAETDPHFASEASAMLASIGESPQATPVLVETKKKTDRYPDGKVKRERTVNVYSNKEEKYDGIFKEWYPDGQLWSEGQYVQGRRTGKWQFFGQNGKLTKVGTYKNGLPDGTCNFFHPDGTPWREEDWVEGKRNGKWKVYDETGKHLIKQEEYKNNQFHGVWKTWYLDGQLTSEEHYFEGKRHGTQSSWYPSGKPRVIVEYRNGKQNGKMTVWKENGNKFMEREYRDGEPVR